MIELTYEPALKSYWRKEALKKFPRASYVSEHFLATWRAEESKRDFLDKAFQKLQAWDKGRAVISEMARNLSEQTTFPDLRNWEDSPHKLADAAKAVAELKGHLKAQDQEIQSEKEKVDAKTRARETRQKVQRSHTGQFTLQQRLDGLHPAIGTQQGGYDFQDWFYDLLDFCEFENRRPYMNAGRQIDGSLTLDGTTYLVELKFTASQADATDIDSLRSKVDDTANNTMGVRVSICGYTRVAVTQASGRKTTLLLFDAQHLYLFLTGALSFKDVILRIRRHASQTSEAYLPVANFGG